MTQHADGPATTGAHATNRTAPSVAGDPVARTALLILCVIVAVAALDIAQMIFAPVCLSIVVGSIFGPAADRLCRLGVPSWVSAASMVILFITFILTVGAALMVPLSDWLDRLPLIWSRLQAQLVSWQGVFSSIGSLQEELRNAMGQSREMKVSVEETSAVESVFYFAPNFVAQVILFLASLYFFILTRPYLRRSALDFASNPLDRDYMSNVFKKIGERLSTYLLSITLVNVGLGVAVTLAMWALGVPSPALWGMLAGLLNYVIYVGPAVMVVVMTCVGLAIGDTPLAIATPPLVYLALNLTEAQFVTPTVLGRTMTLNPFVVFLSIAFWIWLWGPVGGFVAVPILMVAATILEIAMERD